MNITKAVKITLSLSINGYSWYESIWDIKEANKIYILKKKDDYGEVIEKRIPKEKFDVITDGTIINTHRLIQFTCVTSPDKVDYTKDLLLKKVNELARVYEQELQQLISNIK